MRMLKLILIFIIISLPALAKKQVGDWQIEGAVSSTTLAVIDDLSSITVAIVYDANGDELGIVAGRDIVTECTQTGRTCEFRSLEDLELVLGRTTDAETSNLGSFDSYTLLQSLSIRLDGKSKSEKYSAKINGNLSASFKDDRALVLLGNKKYRFRFTEAYGQYDEKSYRVRLGRQATTSGTVFDGVSGDYKMGTKGSEEDKTIGVFVGMGPDPVTTHPNMDRVVFGSSFHLIPEFSSRTQTKLRLDANLVMETYKGDVDRFYLNSRAHFTPLRTLSLFAYNTLELPWLSSSSVESSLFSLNTHWRPTSPWFFSLGFSQFRIDRHLRPESIQYLIDPGSQQTTRVGETIDRSDRYRIDLRTSYKPVYFLQPYVQGRYERRSFNSVNAQNDSGNDNLLLTNKKNAFRGILGTRVFPLDELETQSEVAYDDRFQSQGWYLYQAAYWDDPRGFTADIYFQFHQSSRTQDISLTNQDTKRKTTDYYAGLGGSYRFYTDFLGQIRYDFASEDDWDLGSNTYIHTLLLRLTYRF